MNESETRTTETTVTQTATPVPTTPVTETVVTEYPNRYARNDPGSFAAGEETTPEQDAAERTHPGTFGDTEPTP
jgi:hypothetical protein